jgi:riboflavin biosynthesis pyrimidine reductase
VADVEPAAVYAEVRRVRDDGRPWVMANMVSSLDGSAAVAGRTKPLSGSADRLVFGLLRALADVVLVGAETVRVERYGPVAGEDPCPIAVVSRSLELDWHAPLFNQAGERTIVVTCTDADPGRRTQAATVAEVIVAGSERVDMAGALGELGERGHHLVLCEGGPHLLGELVAADLVDELCLTLSPLLAGADGPRLLAGPGPTVPVGLQVASVIEDDDTLLLRYLRR